MISQEQRAQRRAHRLDCPQPACWGPWTLDSDADSMTLFEEESGTGMQIGLWWPAISTRVMHPALTSMAFLVHVQWAGPRFTSGLLNAYADIYRLRDYEPTLARLRYKQADVRCLIREAIGKPDNLLHVWSLSDRERFRGHANTLYYEDEDRRRPVAVDDPLVREEGSRW